MATLFAEWGFLWEEHAVKKNMICIWYDRDAEAAARFYVETFPDSTVNSVYRAPGDYPSGKEGTC